MGRRRAKSKDLTKSTWAIRARKALDVANDVADNVMRLRDKPKVTDFVALGTKFAHRVISQLEGEIYDYFEDWHDISDISFKDELMDAIRKFEPEQVGGRDDYAIMVADIYGEEVGWIRTSPSDKSDGRGRAPPMFEGPYIDFERYDETFNALGRAFWEHMESTKVLLGATSKIRYDHNEQKTRLRPDRDISRDVHESQRGIDIYERIRKFYDHGKNRSVVLLGPPGTGKTTIMKYIASRFDKHTMRINVSELASMNINSVVAAVQLLKPEVLLIDDFDMFNRSSDSMILTQLEQVNKAVRVFIVSVNDISEIDPAVIRPGRFDEIIEINDIDDGIMDRLIGDLPEPLRKVLRTWPVAYIEEFSKRYEVLGAEDALREVMQLRHRIDKINNSRYQGFELDEVVADDDVDEAYLENLFAELNKELKGKRG